MFNFSNNLFNDGFGDEKKQRQKKFEKSRNKRQQGSFIASGRKVADPQKAWGSAVNKVFDKYNTSFKDSKQSGDNNWNTHVGFSFLADRRTDDLSIDNQAELAYKSGLLNTGAENSNDIDTFNNYKAYKDKWFTDKNKPVKESLNEDNIFSYDYRDVFNETQKSKFSPDNSLKTLLAKNEDKGQIVTLIQKHQENKPNFIKSLLDAENLISLDTFSSLDDSKAEDTPIGQGELMPSAKKASDNSLLNTNTGDNSTSIKESDLDLYKSDKSKKLLNESIRDIQDNIEDKLKETNDLLKKRTSDIAADFKTNNEKYNEVASFGAAESTKKVFDDYKNAKYFERTVFNNKTKFSKYMQTDVKNNQELIEKMRDENVIEETEWNKVTKKQEDLKNEEGTNANIRIDKTMMEQEIKVPGRNGKHYNTHINATESILIPSEEGGNSNLNTNHTVVYSSALNNKGEALLETGTSSEFKVKYDSVGGFTSNTTKIDNPKYLSSSIGGFSTSDSKIKSQSSNFLQVETQGEKNTEGETVNKLYLGMNRVVEVAPGKEKSVEIKVEINPASKNSYEFAYITDEQIDKMQKGILTKEEETIFRHAVDKETDNLQQDAPHLVKYALSEKEKIDSAWLNSSNMYGTGSQKVRG